MVVNVYTTKLAWSMRNNNTHQIKIKLNSSFGTTKTMKD
jgi:hypothetical protein